MLHQTIKLYPGWDDVTLTTYVIEHSEEFLGRRRRPAVLICPGGGYLVCSEGEGEPVAIAFNRMGYNAFVLHYSVYADSSPSFILPSQEQTHPGPLVRDGPSVLEPKERSMFPNPMLDIKAAMEKIRENAALWRTATEQIALCGFSAGAHNVGIYCACADKRKMPRPVAAILGYPLGDIRDNLRPGMTRLELTEQKNVCVAMVGASEPDDAAMDRVSIPRNIDGATPPMFIWNTSEDQTVMPLHALRIAEALGRNHVPYELHTFERGPHGLSTADECSAISAEQVRPDVSVWMELADTWLKKRLRVPLPEHSPFE